MCDYNCDCEGLEWELEQYEKRFEQMVSNAGPTAFDGVDGKKYAGKIFLCDDLNQDQYNRLVRYFDDLWKFLNTFKEIV